MPGSFSLMLCDYGQCPLGECTVVPLQNTVPTPHDFLLFRAETRSKIWTGG